MPITVTYHPLFIAGFKTVRKSGLGAKPTMLRRIANLVERVECNSASEGTYTEPDGGTMYEGPEFRHLRYFIALAEECSFHRAAHRLRVSQPALSMQIRQLEEGLDAKLFTRSSAGASLTPAGTALLPHAKQILRLREHAVKQASLAKSGLISPFRFGFTAWINRDVIRETLLGYRVLVPGGAIEPSSHSSGPLIQMLLDGHLNAALISLPSGGENLYTQLVCSERLLICMRSDDPAARQEAVTRTEIQERLRVMFERTLHPLLFDQIERRFAKASVRLHPTHFVSHPADMQFLIKEGAGFGLIRESVQLDPDLVRRPMAGFNLNIKSAFICLPAQQRPILPLLANRLAKFCAERTAAASGVKPAVRVPQPAIGQTRLAS